jgi:GNAT superfamily N-acetyltransferase
MFWQGKITFFQQISAYFADRNVAFAEGLKVPEIPANPNESCGIAVGTLNDVDGICKLLNDHFEQSDAKAMTAITAEFIKASFKWNSAIWILAKDWGGSIRGCVASFRSPPPYPNSLESCAISFPWGIVDWYCVHPLWRDKGVGSDLLKGLDLLTFKIGRKAHIFLKEGLPLPLPHVPVYATFLYCRRAGNQTIKKMRDGTGLTVWPYQTNERVSGLPLVRVEGIRHKNATSEQIKEWELALDTELPPCIVFVTGQDKTDKEKGWKQDTLVSVYAFRWIAGKWLGKPINKEIL